MQTRLALLPLLLATLACTFGIAPRSVLDPTATVAGPVASTSSATATATRTASPTARASATSRPSSTPTLPTTEQVAVTPTPSPTALGGGSGQLVWHVALSETVYNIYTGSLNRAGILEVSTTLSLTHDDRVNITPRWSPDGQFVVFVSDRDGDRDIYRMRADGSEVVNLTNNFASDDAAAWSADGAWVVFSSDRDQVGNREIYKMRPDGSNVVRLTNDPAQDTLPAFAPDGARIVFVSNRTDNNSEIYVMQADGTQPQRLTTDPAEDLYPTWSRDGAFIVFVSKRDGDFDLYRLDLPLTTTVTATATAPIPQPLTVNSAVDGSPAFSPDGQWLAFDSFRDGNYEIYLLDLATLGITRVTRNAWFDAGPDWRP